MRDDERPTRQDHAIYEPAGRRGVHRGALTTLVVELALRRLGRLAYIQVRQAEHAYFPWYIGAILVPTYIAVVMLVILARKADSPALRPATAALILLVLALVVSFAVNAPINLDQLGWNAQEPPADWASVRDRWQIAHAVRTLFCVIALGCLGAAAIDRPFERAAVPLRSPSPSR